MDIHEFMQSLGQWLYVALTTAGRAIGSAFEYLIEQINIRTMQVHLPMMPTMMKLFSNKQINRIIFYTAAGYIALMNIAAVSMFAADKVNARKRKKRISEKTLMRICFFGGALGGIIGMSVFRHKTNHRKFTAGIPVMFVMQLVIDSFLIGFLGFWAFF